MNTNVQMKKLFVKSGVQKKKFFLNEYQRSNVKNLL